MSYPDRGYVNLLGHLQQEKTSVQLETIEAAICHYLVHTPIPFTSPTPLTAAVIASPLWHSISYKTATSLTTTFRNAMILKFKLLQDQPRGIFSASAKRSLASWVDAVLLGLQDGDPILKLAISGGLLLGMQDPFMKDAQRRRLKVEQELVLTLANLLDMYSPDAYDSWGADYGTILAMAEAKLRLSVLLASQFFSFVSEDVFKALNLPSLADACILSIQSAFHHGMFLQHLRDAIERREGDRIGVKSDSAFAEELKSMVQADEFTSVGALCKLLAQTISVSTIGTSPKRRFETWELLRNTCSLLEAHADKVEQAWALVPEVHVSEDEVISPDSREIMRNVWTVLKTLLFSTLLLSQAILSAVLYVPPPSSPPYTEQRAPGVALSTAVLEVLHHLAFIISKFGGVAATEGGFKELKRVFYTALDILSSDKLCSEAFVSDLARQNVVKDGRELDEFLTAKKSFEFACIEQLTSEVSEECLEKDVVPMCQPHLEDVLHRETYEAAHSVLLSIFAAHSNEPNNGHLATRLVPGYVKTLLDNAQEGKMNTVQLRLAFGALVRSANGGSTTHLNPQENRSSDVLAWYCVTELLAGIHKKNEMRGREADGRELESVQAEYEKLCLTLISLVTNVSPSVLPQVLDELEDLIAAEQDADVKAILFEELFQEILKVGPGEKELAMRWWHERITPLGVRVDEVDVIDNAEETQESGIRDREEL